MQARVPDSVMLYDPTSSTVLPASHLRRPHESAFTSPNFVGNSLLPSAPADESGSSYSHRKRPTLARPFIAYHKDFLRILSQEPKLSIVVRDEQGRALYHEAGVWVEETQQVFLTSNRMEEQMKQDSKSGLHSNLITMSMLDLATGKVQNLDATTSLPSANGACLFRGQLLVCDQGYSVQQPSQLVLVDPKPPHTVTPILNNFHGRPFNSLNDVVVLPTPGHDYSTIWFTDPTYGYEQGFKPPPGLPSQVYCFDPFAGTLRVVADGFVKPNGIAFDMDGKRCFVTDTGLIRGCGNIDGARPSTIYVFDVEYPPVDIDPSAAGPHLTNRRVFACTDSGAPDGIKLDNEGNVYAGCFDGLHIWNKWGTLIGKCLFPRSDGTFDGCANFCFVPCGRIVCMAEDKVYLVEGLTVKGALL